MLAKKLLLLGGVAVALSAVGCIRNCHTSTHECLRPIEDVAVIAPARAKVYVFLMNGSDVFDVGHLKELECSILQAGFPKVYYAQQLDQEWYYKELHRLRRDDPDNRFVLLAQGTGAEQMRQLVCRVTTDGIPLDAVVYLDPIGATDQLTQDVVHPTTVLRSRLWPESPRHSTAYSLTIPEVGHARLPNHPAVVEQVLGILTDSARRVPIVRKPIDCIPLTDEPKPIPRPHEPKQVPPYPANWDALCPNSGQR
jgi:hypothetical protein